MGCPTSTKLWPQTSITRVRNIVVWSIGCRSVNKVIERFFASRSAIQPFILIALLMASALHTLSGVSRPATNLVLVTLRMFLVCVFRVCGEVGGGGRSVSGRSRLKDSQRALLDSIPRDVRTALSHLGVEPEFVLYAACPSCSCVYAPDPNNPLDPYPHICLFSETDKPCCRATLIRQDFHAGSTRGDGEQRATTHSPPPALPIPHCGVLDRILVLQGASRTASRECLGYVTTH